MPGCLVPGCTSGYKSNFEKVHFFSVPKDEKLKEQWQIAIKRPNTLVSKTQVVCDKHFLAGDIIRSRQLLGPEGEVLGVSPYRRPRLAPGAVPSLFPWTEVISSDNDIDANPETSEVNLVPDHSNASEKQVVDTFSVNINTVDRLEELQVGQSSDVCLYTDTPANIINNLEALEANSCCNSVEVFNFEALLTSNMELPSSWMRNNIKYKEESLISFSYLICDMIDGKYLSFNLKEVIVDSKLELYTHILDKPLNVSPYFNVKKSITSVNDLEEYLRQVNSLKVCRGIVIPDINEYENSDALVIDKRNMVRRETCTLLCHSTQCNACHNASRALVRKRKRNNTNLQDSRSINKKSNVLSSKFKSHAKTMSQKSEASVLNKLRSNDVAKNQCDVVQEILKASHCKNSSGRRYSENWLMLCMLLYMRSVSGYNFIRDNNILPLPCVSTMRRNLASINTQCGFDSEFFEAFTNF
ncbi:hypothetical protein KQX54_012472 [Cotesia glomerata]|uniref:THAP-type domain-containing protein n=1 Tax=Cotesia glomerata TaxID=32391 RepID=A0AAV7HTL9_COTGL|nr:hypothetical protein KQX54_012472 [Cotesia glomerata]